MGSHILCQQHLYNKLKLRKLTPRSLSVAHSARLDEEPSKLGMGSVTKYDRCVTTEIAFKSDFFRWEASGTADKLSFTEESSMH